MKILLANFTRMVDDAGGMAKVTAAFANEMVRRGHQVTLLPRKILGYKTPDDLFENELDKIYAA